MANEPVTVGYYRSVVVDYTFKGRSVPVDGPPEFKVSNKAAVEVRLSDEPNRYYVLGRKVATNVRVDVTVDALVGEGVETVASFFYVDVTPAQADNIVITFGADESLIDDTFDAVKD